MAVKVEVITPESTVSDVAGTSTSIEVIRPTQPPISTSGNQAVVDVVQYISVVNNVVVDSIAPSAPFEGMVWLEIP